MKDFLLNIVHLGIVPEDDFHVRTLKIVLNILLYNSLFLQLLVVSIAIFVEGNYDVLYLMAFIPVYAIVFYFNYKGKTHIAFTILFTIGT